MLRIASLSCAATLFFAPFGHPAFPALYNSEPGDPPPVSPHEALKALQLKQGFNATLFAAEPDVQNPIGIVWDAKGRMWVAENRPYAERTKRLDLMLKNRVTYFMRPVQVPPPQAK
jgi:hypothetical protein